MEFELGYLMALVVVGLGILGVILSLAINEISRIKSVVSIILSIIILILGGYYYYVVGLYQSERGQAKGPLNRIIRVYKPESIIRPTPPEKKVVVLPESKPEELNVIIGVEDKKNFLKDREHLKVKRGKKIKIIDAIVPGVGKNLIRVNFVGFVGSPKIKGEDRGYEIDTSSLMKRYALDKKGSCYKIEVLKGKEVMATVFVDLI